MQQPSQHFPTAAVAATAAEESGAVPNLPNVSEHQRRCAAAFMTSKADGRRPPARRACTRANRMAIRVGPMNKPAAHRQVIDILQRLA